MVFGGIVMIVAVASNKSRHLLVPAVAFSFSALMLINASFPTYQAGAATMYALCDCEFFLEAGVVRDSLSLSSVRETCEDDRDMYTALLVLHYCSWVVMVAATWFSYTLSEKLQSGTTEAGESENQSAWYTQGDHGVAKYRGIFIALIPHADWVYFGLFTDRATLSCRLKLRRVR